MQQQPWNDQDDSSDNYDDGYAPRMDPRGPPMGFGGMPPYDRPPPSGFMQGPPPHMPSQGISIYIPHSASFRICII